MKKTFLLIAFAFCATAGFSQADKTWTSVSDRNVKANKNTQRLSFPGEFNLMRLSLATMQQTLQNAPQRNVSTRQSGVIISLPNTNGQLERYEVLEASNFTPELQAQFPHIRAYVGKGIDDKNAVLRMSVDSRGIQAMIFRTDKRNEFIEPYSEDASVYAVYHSSRSKGHLPWTCSTDDVAIAASINPDEANRSNTQQLLTFRLALSCNAEYTQYFGGTIADALEAMNATMTRVNGVFEMDFAIHMNMVDNTSVIFTNPDTDPYTSMGQWNNQLQATLTANIGEANYDVGHMFGATGGGGNAGCIGCVCVNNQKGRGITSPADGIPMGDNFDIDYVAHELGHQFGGNHTFSNNVEGSGVNVEPGSGSTIMGYAGITSQDIANHSDAYFVYASIKQVQDNMVGKACPVRTPLANTPPVANAGGDYVIPIGTPYVLTGSATDAEGDTLLYCWEQNDSATTQTGNGSQASPTKTGGPNWRSYDPTASPSRYFPPLARVAQNQLTTVFEGITSEAISTVARECNFVLTVRDRDLVVGQTNSDFMKVTTTAAAGPFLLTAPNTAISIMGGTSQEVTWNVAGTTGNGINVANVDIFLSTDGGLSYPISLADNVPNDGSHMVTMPDIPGTQNRVMVKAHNHIFFDVSNVNFTITTAASTFVLTVLSEQTTQNSCQGTEVLYNFLYDTLNGFDDPTTFSVTGQPAGTSVTFTPNPIVAPGSVVFNVADTASATPGHYEMTITGTSGSEVKNITLYYDLYATTFPATALTTPANGAITQPTVLTLEWDANTNATSYDVELSTDATFSSGVISGTSDTNSYDASGLSTATVYYWRVKPKNPSCEGEFSGAFSFETGNIACSTGESTNVPITISTSGTPTVNSTFEVPVGSGGEISDVNVSVNIDHTWVRDLIVTLISPTGTQVRLVNRPCTNVALNDIVATFDDAGTAVTCANNPAIGGTVTPVDVLSALNGQSSEGTWTLRVQDQANQDGGAILGWSLNICSNEPLGVAENQLSDFALYPNPNSGNFTVQFKANTPDVKVNVHDIRGRQIFQQSYKNSGMFYQNIQMNSAAPGIYLVTVESGSQKETRKIVVQ